MDKWAVLPSAETAQLQRGGRLLQGMAFGCFRYSAQNGAGSLPFHTAIQRSCNGEGPCSGLASTVGDPAMVRGPCSGLASTVGDPAMVRVHAVG